MENLQVAFKMYKGAENGKEGDSFLYRDNLFMVAEGVGGEYVSEIAQQQACRIIPETFQRLNHRAMPSSMPCVKPMKAYIRRGQSWDGRWQCLSALSM